MTLEATHPLYARTVTNCRMMRHMYEGERVVKEMTTEYLPPTPGMELDGMEVTAAGKGLGRKVYEGYLKRAVFPDYVKQGVEALVGLLHQKPPTIELPPQMEELRNCATSGKESLELLLRRINEEQLITGRLGLLLDLPENPDPTKPIPYVSTYVAETVRNWNSKLGKLEFVVLDESGFKLNGDFEWETLTAYRVLKNVASEGNKAQYKQALFTQDGTGGLTYVEDVMVAPLLRGVALEEVPFVFVNTKDILPDPDTPPLLGLARLCLTIYRGEADYRQSLAMQGQDTLVVIGGVRAPSGVPGENDDAIRTGAGSRIDIDIGGDAKYIGVSSLGLPEQRQALETDHNRAQAKAGQMVNATASNQESGIALQTRIAAQTATLNQIALSGAAGLESILKSAARWMGCDETKVKVTPNVEFADFQLGAAEIVQLMTARSMGAPLSLESIHSVMAERGITKLDYETELGKVEEEIAASGLTGTDAGGDPANDKDPENKDPVNANG